jgi:hypothetical protein
MAHRHGPLSCSFCGKRQEQVQRLIAGPGVYICDACIHLCNEILAANPPAAPTPPGVSQGAHGRWRGNISAPWWRRLLGRWPTDAHLSMES